MLATFAIRRWLHDSERIELSSADFTTLLDAIDAIPAGRGVIADLDAARANLTGNGAIQLARVLALRDDPTKPFGAFNAESPAEHDDETMALGIYSREEAITYSLDIAQNREAMRIRLSDPDGPSYGRGILRRVLLDIRSISEYWSGRASQQSLHDD